MAGRRGPRPVHRREGNKAQKNPLKKRMRDLKRQLERKDNLPADVRIHHERELASCQYELDQAEKHSQRSRIIKKYHMVRFFERKNATKLLNRARKELEAASEAKSRQQIEMRIHQLEVDLNYTRYFPLHMAYPSLYAGTKTKEGKIDSDRVDRTSTMWKVVEQATATGRLDDLREGRLDGYREEDTGLAASQQRPAVKEQKGKGAASKKQPAKRATEDDGGTGEDDDDDDDAEDGQGFFE